MKRNKVLLILIIILSGCLHKNRDKLESFVWIENNRNWISDDSTKLEAISAINFTENCKKATLAKIKKSDGLYDFFSISVSDSLRELIYHNFQGNEFPEYYRQNSKKNLMYNYDGNIFCIIYKFSNKPARIMNYIPYEVPNRLLPLIEMLKTLSEREPTQVGAKFPIIDIVNKYRHSMFYFIDILPPLPPDSTTRYEPPIIVDTLK
jgi:hypothetical protein